MVERSDQQVVGRPLGDGDEHLVLARLAQERRRHLVGGGLLLQLGLVRLAVERDLDRRGRDRRIVVGAVEIDDEHLALDDADELVALRGGDNARRGDRRPRRRAAPPVVVAFVRRGGDRERKQQESEGATNGCGGASAARQEAASESRHGRAFRSSQG